MANIWKKVNALILLSLFLISLAYATEESTAYIAEKYSGIEKATDRIKLLFTIKEEKRIELMNKISEKRLSHYNFLMANGKTEQASRFKVGTESLMAKFTKQKAEYSQRAISIITNIQRGEK